ncbi:MAG TPA: ABC transporter substrate-binding protein [Rugosimonospora sp.]|nr:ABC transporter substrate-binding protein [Rugosimonospora sp.]
MRGFRLAAAGAALTVALTACADTGSTSGGTVDTLTINMAFGRGLVTENFNPFSPKATEGTLGYVFEPLMGIDTLHGGKLIPWLASAEQVSADGKTLTLTLDPRATWSDGSPVTADDVVFTFDTLKNNQAANYQHSVTVNTATATAAHTAVLTFDGPVYTELGAVVQEYIVPKKYWQGKDPVTWTNPKPVGSGPYQEQRLTPQQVTLVARSNYWKQSTIAVKHINFPLVTANSTTEVSNLLGGTEDVSGGAIPDVVNQFVKKDPAHAKIFYPTYGALFLFFNLDNPLFATNVHLRRAIVDALDKQQLIDLTTQLGAYPISQTGLDQKTQAAWLDSGYRQAVTTDTAAAVQELAQGGYTVKNGRVVDGAGKQLSFSIMEVSEYADSVQRDKLIADQLDKLGLNVTVDPVASGTYGDNRAKGRFDLITGGFAYGATPFDMYNALLNSQFAGSKGGGEASYDNFERFRDPATDALLRQFQTAATTDQQAALARQLEKTVMDDAPFVTLSSITAGCAYTTKNWVGWPDEQNPYAICAPWIGGPYNTQVVLNLKPAR